MSEGEDEVEALAGVAGGLPGPRVRFRAIGAGEGPKEGAALPTPDQLTRDEQVSGWSPLVALYFVVIYRGNYAIERGPGAKVGTNLL